VSSVFTDSSLIIDVLYDSPTSDNEERLTLDFSNTCFFSLSSFPGVKLTDIEYESFENLGSLVEYEDSSAAQKWSNQLPFYGKIRHFIIYFLSENKCLEVFAAEFKLDSQGTR